MVVIVSAGMAIMVICASSSPSGLATESIVTAPIVTVAPNLMTEAATVRVPSLDIEIAARAILRTSTPRVDETSMLTSAPRAVRSAATVREGALISDAIDTAVLRPSIVSVELDVRITPISPLTLAATDSALLTVIFIVTAIVTNAPALRVTTIERLRLETAFLIDALFSVLVLVKLIADTATLRPVTLRTVVTVSDVVVMPT
jgi:hypothetical protein